MSEVFTKVVEELDEEVLEQLCNADGPLDIFETETTKELANHRASLRAASRRAILVVRNA